MSLVATASSTLNLYVVGAGEQLIKGPLPHQGDIFFPSAQPFTHPQRLALIQISAVPLGFCCWKTVVRGPVQTQCLLGKPSGTQATEPPHLQRKGHGFHSLSTYSAWALY